MLTCIAQHSLTCLDDLLTTWYDGLGIVAWCLANKHAVPMLCSLLTRCPSAHAPQVTRCLRLVAQLSEDWPQGLGPWKERIERAVQERVQSRLGVMLRY